MGKIISHNKVLTPHRNNNISNPKPQYSQKFKTLCLYQPFSELKTFNTCLLYTSLADLQFAYDQLYIMKKGTFLFPRHLSFRAANIR